MLNLHNHSKSLYFSLILIMGCFFSLDTQAGTSTTPKNLDLGVNLQVKAYLQGCYNRTTGLMRDTLRSKSMLPLQQPYSSVPFLYTGTETLNRSLSSITIGGDGDALVDWVLLELRSSADSKTIIAQKALGVQADGDLMDTQTGESQLNFANVTAGSYYVVLRHRNHLGVMSANPQALSAMSTVIDFSNPNFSTAGTHARALDGNKALLWTGDINQDHRVIANGVSNDLNSLITAILSDPANTGLNASYRLVGYAATDLNLDGDSLATGPGNDSNLLVTNITSHPANPDAVANFIISGGGY